MNENNIQNEQEITETPIEETEQYEESYSIYEFFKNDTSFLIAVASALIAIAAAFLKMCSSIYQNGYLKYWNINPKFADNVSSYWFETIAFSFLFFVVVVFSSLVISSNLPIYLNQIEVSISRIIKIYRNKREIKGVKKELKHTKLKLSKLKDSIEKDELSEIIERLEKENKDINRECKNLEKSMCEINVAIICEMTKYTILIGLVFISFGFPVIFQGDANSNLSLVAIGLCYAMIVFAFAFLSIIMIIIRALRKKTLSFNKYSKEEVINIFSQKPSLKRILSSHSDRYLSDKTIKFALILIMIYVLFFSLNIIIFNDSIAKNQKEFQIINNNSITYAILHVDDSNVIAERIEINDKNAVIYVNEQIIIPKEEIEMKVYTFKNVTRDNT